MSIALRTASRQMTFTWQLLIYTVYLMVNHEPTAKEETKELRISFIHSTLHCRKRLSSPKSFWIRKHNNNNNTQYYILNSTRVRVSWIEDCVGIKFVCDPVCVCKHTSHTSCLCQQMQSTMDHNLLYHGVDNVCRGCLGKKGDMQKLFGTCLDTMLMTVADVQVGCLTLWTLNIIQFVSSRRFMQATDCPS